MVQGKSPQLWKLGGSALPASPSLQSATYPHLKRKRKPPGCPFKWLDLNPMSSTSAPTPHRPGTGRGTSSCATEPVSPRVPHPLWRRGGTRPSGNQFSPHPVPQAAHSILSQAGAGMGEVGRKEENSLASSGADPPGNSRPGRDHRPKPPGEGAEGSRSVCGLCPFSSSQV